jgi:hypothetical protein
MEFLCGLSQTAKEEAETKAEKQVGENTAEDGGLDDGQHVALVAISDGRIVMLGDQDDEEDNFNNAAKGRLKQDSGHLGHLPGEFLSSKAEKIGRGNDGDVADDKLGDVHTWKGMKDERCNDEWPENIDEHGGRAGAAPEHMKEVPRVEAAAAALPFVVVVVVVALMAIVAL